MAENFLLFETCFPKSDISCQTTSWMRKIVPQIITVFGLIGNTLSIAVMLRKDMRRRATTLFFVLLPVFDSLSLLTMSTRITISDIFEINLSVISPNLCKSIIFVLFVSRHISLYILALIAGERSLFISYPMKARNLVTNCKRIILFAIVAVWVLTFQSIITLGIGADEASKNIYRNGSYSYDTQGNVTHDGNTTAPLTKSQCSVMSNKYSDATPTLKTIAGLLIIPPTSCILIFNFFVIGKLIYEQRKGNYLSDSTVRSRVLSYSSKVALLETTAYLLTMIPVFTFVIYTIYKPKDSIGPSDVLVLNVLLFFELAGIACNFLLYSCAGSTFREELKDLLRDLKKRLLCDRVAQRDQHVEVQKAIQGRWSQNAGENTCTAILDDGTSVTRL